MGDGAVHTQSRSIVAILNGAADPTAGGGVAASLGWLYYNTSTASLWHKTGSGATAWTRVLDLTDLHTALFYRGVIDCSTNPDYPAANSGDVYLVSVAGKIGGASGVVVNVQDMLLCKVDNSPSGNQAAVGANWDIIEANLTKGDLSESTSSILTITGGTGAVMGSGTTIQVKKADSANDGYLSSSDWNSFNSKPGGNTPVQDVLAQVVSSQMTPTTDVISLGPVRIGVNASVTVPADSTWTVEQVNPVVIPPVRQTVLASESSLVIGSGLSVTNAASIYSPVSVAFSNGNFHHPFDYVGYCNSTQTWSNLTANANQYLYYDYDPETGLVTTGSTAYIPIYEIGITQFVGSTVGSILSTFEGADGLKWHTDLTNNPWTFSTNASISTTRYYNGSSSVRLTGGSGYVQTPFPTLNSNPTWTMRFWCYIDNATVTQILLQSLAAYSFRVYIASSNLYMSLSSNGSSFDICTKVGAHTISSATWYQIELSWDGATYRLFYGTSGTSTLECSQASALPIYAPGSITLGDTAIGLIGNVDDFQFLPYCLHTDVYTIDTTTPTVELSYFDINTMTMYKGYPGIGNPSKWTKCNRVFRGECITGASTVSSVCTYALNGRYVSPTSAQLVAGGKYAITHNIGCIPWDVETELVCLTADGGFSPGDITKSWGTNVNGGAWTVTYSGPGKDDGSVSRLVNYWYTPNSAYGPWFMYVKTGNGYSINYFYYGVRQRIKRGW